MPATATVESQPSAAPSSVRRIRCQRRAANVVLTPFCAVAGAGKRGGGPGLGRRVGFARPRGEEAQGLPRSAHPVAARSEEFAGQLRRSQRVEGIRGIWGCGGRCVRRGAALHRRPALRRRAGLALAPAQRQGRADLHAVVWGGHADATLEPDAAGATVAGWDPARHGRHGQHQRATEHLGLVRLLPCRWLPSPAGSDSLFARAVSAGPTLPACPTATRAPWARSAPAKAR